MVLRANEGNAGKRCEERDGSVSNLALLLAFNPVMIWPSVCMQIDRMHNGARLVSLIST